MKVLNLVQNILENNLSNPEIQNLNLRLFSNPVGKTENIKVLNTNGFESFDSLFCYRSI